MVYTVNPKGKEVAILVLNWNGVELLRQFLPNWIALTPDWADLWIVDNGSTDASLQYIQEQYPEVKCLDLGKNYGFASGYNRAIKALDYAIIVLLNSDVALSSGWLEQPMQILRTQVDVVAVQPKIRSYKSPDYFEYAGASGGYLDALAYPYCAGRIFDVLEKDMGQYDWIKSITWASGACLIIRREAYLDAGGLDELFFAHQEEIDLCWRLRARGGELVLSPQSVVYHIGGASLEVGNPHKVYLNFRNNLLMVYKNASLSSILYILPLRFVLDIVAMFRFVILGQIPQSLAVAKAWIDALRMFPLFTQQRKENLRLRGPKYKVLSPRLLIWQYYVLGRKKFSEIR